MNDKRKQKITTVVHQRHAGIIVVLEDIHDPHNAAAILRTCDGLGIQNIYFIFEKETPYNPKKVGKASSSSANKWVDFKVFTNTRSCIQELKKERYAVITTALTETAESILKASFPEDKIAVIVGNEHRGVSHDALILSDRIIMIPMMGFVQSLNVSVATAITLWEISKQRKNTRGWQLSEQAQKILTKDFLSRGKKKIDTTQN